jgi:hypothetical protein
MFTWVWTGWEKKMSAEKKAIRLEYSLLKARSRRPRRATASRCTAGS